MIKQKDTTEGKKEVKKRAKKVVPVPVEYKEEKQEIRIDDSPEVKATLEAIEEETTEEKSKKPDRYFEGVGRRKTAIARVRLFTRPGDFLVNEKPHIEFFKTIDQQKIVEEALQKMKLFGRFRVSVRVRGGGSHAQAEAVRHGLARCLVKFNPDFRKRLKRAEFLKRDPRMKERKKFGLKKARKAPQWAKR